MVSECVKSILSFWILLSVAKTASFKRSQTIRMFFGLPCPPPQPSKPSVVYNTSQVLTYHESVKKHQKTNFWKLRVSQLSVASIGSKVLFGTTLPATLHHWNQKIVSMEERNYSHNKSVQDMFLCHIDSACDG